MDDSGLDSAAIDPQGYSAGSFQYVRESHVKKLMRKRANEFTELQNTHIFLGTWNVNAKKPSDEPDDLADWLVHDDVKETPDIYIVGFQEIVDLTAVNLVTDHTAAKPWEERILNVLNKLEVDDGNGNKKPNQYVRVRNQHLVGLSLSMFCTKAIQPTIGNIADHTVGVGVMGVGGNKGAVAIRFTVSASSVVVVNSHLAAHKKNVQGRNADFRNICARLEFPAIKADAKAQPQHFALTSRPGQMSLFDHDHVFWIGDLNYRLNLDDLTAVYHKVEVADWPYLLAHDQLLLEKAKGTTFKGWEEGPINFAPSYKYTPGTDEFDKVKLRFPAWCDRIQWIPGDIHQLFYRRSRLKCSDHKPVSSLFRVNTKTIVRNKQQEVYASIVRQLDDWENKAIPKVELSRNSIHFSNVTFDIPVKQRFTITNVGVGALKFRFVPKLEDQEFKKPWLNVEPDNGYLPPDESIDLELTVHVDRNTAQALNTEEDKLQDILILRLENGRDYFLTVSGDYLKSCFGSTIEYLVQTPGPVRYSSPHAEQVDQPSKVLSIPKELWRMVDYIYRNGMDEEGLFVTDGDAEQIEMIRECLDTGQNFGKYDIHSMAETLVRFLKSLAEPIFPSHLAQHMPDTMQLTPWCMQALVKLSPAKYNSFIYMTSFLREVLKHKANQLTVDQLVSTFSSCLMHWDQMKFAEQRLPTRSAKEWKILKHFLTSTEFE